MTDYALDRARAHFHESLCKRVLGFRADKTDTPNIADSSGLISKRIARSIMNQIPYEPCRTPPSGQGAGTTFTACACEFLQESMELLAHLRPWAYRLSMSQAKIGIGAYAQYKHLADVQSLIDGNPDLRSWLGTDYMVTPDLVMLRLPYADTDLNATQAIVGPGSSGGLSPARCALGGEDTPILHASVSCKWTIRSDRAQNSRLEGLNLLRNRKGRAPHICSLTFEPLPSRIESVASGTGDIDCVYHAALYELEEATTQHGNRSEMASLEAMIQGRRLRDISDLALDLLL